MDLLKGLARIVVDTGQTITQVALDQRTMTTLSDYVRRLREEIGA